MMKIAENYEFVIHPREVKLRFMNKEEDARATMASMPIGGDHAANYKRERLRPSAEKNRLIASYLSSPSPEFTPSIGEAQTAGVVLAAV